MLENLPKMFGGRAAVRNDDNVTPLQRDTEPTRPQRPQWHQTTPNMDWPSGAYGPKPRAILTPYQHERAKVDAIFLALADEPKDARDRISEQVLMLLKMYGDGEMPTVEGAPV